MRSLVRFPLGHERVPVADRALRRGDAAPARPIGGAPDARAAGRRAGLFAGSPP